MYSRRFGYIAMIEFQIFKTVNDPQEPWVYHTLLYPLFFDNYHSDMTFSLNTELQLFVFTYRLHLFLLSFSAHPACLQSDEI